MAGLRTRALRAAPLAGLALYLLCMRQWLLPTVPKDDLESAATVLTRPPRPEEESWQNELAGPETAAERATINLGNAALGDGDFAATPDLCFSDIGRTLPGTPGPVALASFPGSGNSWIRHVLQQGTRVATGAMYNDESLKTRFPAEGVRDGSVLVIKTHFPCKGCWSKARTGRPVPVARTGDPTMASGALYVIRSPFDALVAEFNRRSAGLNHTGSVPRSAFQGPEWDAFVSNYISGWVTNVEFWLHAHQAGRSYRDARARPVHLAFYELFVHSLGEEATLMFDWLRGHFAARRGLDLPQTSDALLCLLNDQQGSFRRSSKSRFNPFSQAQRDKICAQVAGLWHADVWGPCTGAMQWERK